jgi:hypothetical protein
VQRWIVLDTFPLRITTFFPCFLEKMSHQSLAYVYKVQVVTSLGWEYVGWCNKRSIFIFICHSYNLIHSPVILLGPMLLDFLSLIMRKSCVKSWLLWLWYARESHELVASLWYARRITIVKRGNGIGFGGKNHGHNVQQLKNTINMQSSAHV